MKFSRNTATKLNYLLNDFLPPVVRDSRRLMYPAFRLLCGKNAHIFMDFRERAHAMSDEEYAECYRLTEENNLLDGTDLNEECLSRIPREVVGQRVLEVGCGRGVLAQRLARDFDVTASDIVLSQEMKQVDGVRFVEAPAHAQPFEDGAFDTVVCTHVLEHVRDVEASMAELRRLARKRLIVVVPRERPARFAFNLHLTFFPYAYSVLQTLAPNQDPSAIRLDLEGGDWFYVEDLTPGE
ncbi:MAG: class I SAM-dependent methyltransferase [Deltaproteobacteria bacterium]|nr:MAG: class I SAM-dependent methyltransferase [Deltaproteobacteria bacterium]